MLLIAYALSSIAGPPPQSPTSQVAALRVSARLVRAGEGSERAHTARRTRTNVEKLSDGREIRVVVFDYE